jgi:hypothetical protein
VIYYQQMLNNAVRCKDPFVRLSGKWLVHQLSPDSSPLEIESMSGIKDQDRLLHAMAWEAANVHLGTAGAATTGCRGPAETPCEGLALSCKGYGKADTR